MPLKKSSNSYSWKHSICNKGKLQPWIGQEKKPLPSCIKNNAIYCKDADLDDVDVNSVALAIFVTLLALVTMWKIWSSNVMFRVWNSRWDESGKLLCWICLEELRYFMQDKEQGVKPHIFVCASPLKSKHRGYFLLKYII